jgi:hypothetical protein
VIDACGVDHDIESAFLLGCRGDELLQSIKLTQIKGSDGRHASLPPDRARCGLQPFRIASGEKNVSSILCEIEGDGTANP